MDSFAPMTEIAKPQKFLFDLSFDGEEGLLPEEREKAKPTYTQEQLDAARQEGFETGQREGRQAAEEARSKQLADLFDLIGKKLDEIMKNADAEALRGREQTQGLALAIARKLMPSYMARFGLGEIEAIVTKVVADMAREPRLVVRVAENLFDEASARINAIAEGRAYAGKLVLLGDAALGPSDCLIEWADGGIERDTAALWQEIEKVIGEVQVLSPTDDEQASSDSGEKA